jgi:SAM-dependent methyltransferase
MATTTVKLRWTLGEVLARALCWLAQCPRLRRWWRRLRRPARLGAFSRPAPVSNNWGFDRGTPIDRYYIERFLARHRGDIRGAVLEVKDDTYTRRFGRGVDRADVVDIDPANPRATIQADLADARSIPDSSFDCFILTQTLHLIYDVEAVVRHAHRILRPGGILLATVPTVSRLRGVGTESSDYWRFTPAACDRLFGAPFGRSHTEIRAHGNVLAAMAFLRGLAWQELPQSRMDYDDPSFPVIVTVRARK